MARTSFIINLKFDTDATDKEKVDMLKEVIKEKARELFALSLILSQGQKPTIKVEVGDVYTPFDEIDINEQANPLSAQEADAS